MIIEQQLEMKGSLTVYMEVNSLSLCVTLVTSHKTSSAVFLWCRKTKYLKDSQRYHEINIGGSMSNSPLCQPLRKLEMGSEQLNLSSCNLMACTCYGLSLMQ